MTDTTSPAPAGGHAAPDHAAPPAPHAHDASAPRPAAHAPLAGSDTTLGHATSSSAVEPDGPPATVPAASTSLPSATRPVNPGLSETLRSLAPGKRVKVTQKVRVGRKQWDSIVEGTFRSWNYLSTGLSTSRVVADDIVVPLVHFTKDNGELSSVTVDEHTKIEVVG